MPTTKAIVSTVADIHSSRVGQVTRRSSAITPRMKSPPAIAWAFFCSFTKGSLLSWQGGQDSNLQPAVLETAALPITPPPFSLSRFPVGTMTATPTAILAQLQPVGRLLLVLLCVVVAAFALAARHHYHHAVLFFGQFPASNSIANMNKTDRRSVRPLMLAQGRGVRKARRAALFSAPAFLGAPGQNRTGNLGLRSPLLYPV
jgi:hypothetical protein